MLVHAYYNMAERGRQMGWIKNSERKPTESAVYMTATIYTTDDVYYNAYTYSAKHGRWNARDEHEPENALDDSTIDYWYDYEKLTPEEIETQKKELVFHDGNAEFVLKH